MRWSRGGALARAFFGGGASLLPALALAQACAGPAFSSAAPNPGSAADAGGETSPPDDSSAPDAPDSSATWCSTQPKHTFCDDFDTLKLPSNFLMESTRGSGLLAYDTTPAGYRSPPNGLLAFTPLATVADSSPSALLVTRSFPQSGTRFVLQADLKISAECVLGSDTVASVAFYFPEYAIALFSTSMNTQAPTGAQLVELTVGPDGGATGLAQHDLRTTLPLGQWFTITIDAQLALRTVGVTVGATEELTGEKLTLEPAVPPQHPTLVVGASVTSSPGVATAGCSVHVDNVLFDVML